MLDIWEAERQHAFTNQLRIRGEGHGLKWRVKSQRQKIDLCFRTTD